MTPRNAILSSLKNSMLTSESSRPPHHFCSLHHSNHVWNMRLPNPCHRYGLKIYHRTWVPQYEEVLYCQLIHRADSRLAPSQCETSLQTNVVSYWLGANLESALIHAERWCVNSFYVSSPWTSPSPQTWRDITQRYSIVDLLQGYGIYNSHAYRLQVSPQCYVKRNHVHETTNKIHKAQNYTFHDGILNT